MRERSIDIARRVVRRAFLRVESLEGRRMLSEIMVSGATVADPAPIDWSVNHLGVQGDPNRNLMLIPSPSTPLLPIYDVPTIQGVPLRFPPAPAPAPIPVPEELGGPPDGYAFFLKDATPYPAPY